MELHTALPHINTNQVDTHLLVELVLISEIVIVLSSILEVGILPSPVLELFVVPSLGKPEIARSLLVAVYVQIAGLSFHFLGIKVLGIGGCRGRFVGGVRDADTDVVGGLVVQACSKTDNQFQRP